MSSHLANEPEPIPTSGAQSLRGRLFRAQRKTPGSVPGTLVHTGQRKVEQVRIRMLDYDSERFDELAFDRIDDCFDRFDDSTRCPLHPPQLHRALRSTRLDVIC